MQQILSLKYLVFKTVKSSQNCVGQKRVKKLYTILYLKYQYIQCYILTLKTQCKAA